jgi:hypothetical protein
MSCMVSGQCWTMAMARSRPPRELFPWRSVEPGLARLLRQPHRVELIVQEVAPRNRPAPHASAARDDAMLLKGVSSSGCAVRSHDPLSPRRIGPGLALDRRVGRSS